MVDCNICDKSFDNRHGLNVHYGRVHPEYDDYEKGDFNSGENNPMYGRDRPDVKGEKNPAKREQVRKKISEFAKSRDRDDMEGENNPAKRKEVREKISKALSGRELTEEHKRNLADSLRGKPNPHPDGCTCSFHSNEPTYDMSGENNPRWKGGYEPYYGTSWSNAREKARERDNYTCQVCGLTENELGQEVDVHHIIPFFEFGVENHKEANSLDNLVCLCRICHVNIEFGNFRGGVLR